MTKPAAAPSTPQSLVSTSDPGPLADLMKEDVGKGLSQAQEDNLVPLIYVLQALSPQVSTRNNAYLEGAEPGMFWMRNAAEPLVDGEEGIVVQPCYFTKAWNEWVPRAKGGGFIARHADCPKDAEQVEDQNNPNKIKFMRPNGNEVIETRNHVIRVLTKSGHAVPFILPFSSTGHTTSRQWMTMMNDYGGAPSFARKYRLKTRERSNAAGTWFAIDVKDEGWVTPEEYLAGRKLHDQFVEGTKVAEAPAANVTQEEIPF